MDETRLPIKKSVASACVILGLDPLMIANEGQMLIRSEERRVWEEVMSADNVMWGW